MSEEIPQANPPLGIDEQLAVAKLIDRDLQTIDAAILAQSSYRWLKVARVITFVEDDLRESFPNLSYVYYTQRLIRLVEDGRLEAQGNPEYIRFSEVRIPSTSDDAEV